MWDCQHDDEEKKRCKHRTDLQVVLQSCEQHQEVTPRPRCKHSQDFLRLGDGLCLDAGNEMLRAFSAVKTKTGSGFGDVLLFLDGHQAYDSKHCREIREMRTKEHPNCVEDEEKANRVHTKRASGPER